MEIIFFQNFITLSLGVAIASILTLGFVVFFSQSESATNRAFLLFTLLTVGWGISNFFITSLPPGEQNIIILRIAVTFALWHAFSFFYLFFVFPSEEKKLPKVFKFFLLPLIFLVSFFTLSPFVFKDLVVSTSNGSLKAVNGPGILAFGVMTTSFVLAGFFILFQKLIKAPKSARGQYYYILVGSGITFSLLLVFNLLLPAVFGNSRFVGLGTVFLLPFILFFAYAIVRHKLLNVKTFTAGLLVFTLSVTTFFQVIFAGTSGERFTSLIVFILVLIFGILLVRGVIREVQNREKIEELANELGNANVKLRYLDQQKSEFVSLASHQLRSPLTAIKGYTSMIKEGTFGQINTAALEAVDKVFQSANNLSNLVEDLLNIARIEQGRMQYEFGKLDLSKLAKQIVGELEVNAKKKGLALNFLTDRAESYFIKGDEGKMRQVILNLIDNAIKYTSHGGITVSIGASDSRILLSVKDTGMGIAKESAERLFEKFSRGDGAGKVNAGGAGIGLFLAKEIVRAHGGRIWFESEGAGRGTAFLVEIEPYKETAPDQNPATSSRTVLDIKDRP